MRYVARQPILDLRGRVHGYELLFRNSPEAPTVGEGDLATLTVLDDSLIFGMEQLTNGLPAFVNCTEESLTEQLVEVLPSSMTVLGIPANMEPEPRMVAALHKLKASGFRLALDDFVWKPRLRPLLELADYIRVDFTLLSSEWRQILRDRLNRPSIAMMAKRVDTQENYRQARGEGFTLFQGDYFCKPEVLKTRKVPANRLFHFEILRQLHRDPIELGKLSQLVMRDASLTYRLLRLVNSPIYAIRQEVRAIETAIMLVGEDAFRRIATLSILSEINADQPPEILQMAQVRGRFCELAARHCAQVPTEQYLLGMLSMLPAMLGMPMESLAPTLPLRDEVLKALQGEPNAERSLLRWLECHEHGDWAACDAIVQSNALVASELLRCYGDAVVWARAALQASA
jgi:EAL and modified HD-GYP domain-containing signal transduction protein